MSDNTRTIIVLIARTGSSRLPGKVLKPILDRPMLALQLERLKRARVPDQIVVATSDQDEDDPIANLANAEGLDVYRGSEEDWARRILEAGQTYKADIIIRVMGDCPLIDPAIVDAVAALAQLGYAEYVATELKPHFPAGMACDAVRTSDLAELSAEMPEADPVTLWSALRDPGRDVQRIALPAPNRIAPYRLTVDEEEDLTLIRTIFEALYPAHPEFALPDILAWCDANPDTSRANAGVTQKTGIHATPETQTAGYKRDSQWVTREYNQDKWPVYNDLIDDLLAENETSLARVYRRTIDGGRNHPGSEPQKIIIDEAEIILPKAFALGGIESLIAAELHVLCREPVEAVVEIGAGIGRNLVSFWLHGGPRDVPYIAYEITEAGRTSAKKFSELSRDFDLRAHDFDLNAPDFSQLPGGDGPIVVFTNHSIEQVPELKTDVFRQLTALGRPIRAIHFEPVGWQIRKSRGQADGRGSSQAYADKHDYNRNFWQVLQSLHDEGVLEIQDARPDFACINSENGTSIVRWQAG